VSRLRKPRATPIYDVNLTPLIDVSLVLVVILLVATPLAFQSSFGVHSASSSGQKADRKADEDRVELTVHEDGDVTVNRRRVPAAALPAVLDEAMASSTSRLVVVRCEDRVAHGTFVHILDETRARGAAAIAVVGR
jgi:biopolymer transport protein TolR